MRPIMVDKAIWAAGRCYQMAPHYHSRFDIQSTLYRAAATARNAATMVEVLATIFQPTEKQETFIDRQTMAHLRVIGEAHEVLATEYRTAVDHGLPEECHEAVAEAFEAAGEVYAGVVLHLDNLPQEPMASVLDTDTPAAHAILAAFDAQNAAEEAFHAEDYHPAMVAFKSAYEAYHMAYLDISTYSSDNPFRDDLNAVERVVRSIRARGSKALSDVGRAETAHGVEANVAAVDALGRAADAAENAARNIRVARLLDDEGEDHE